MTPERIGKYQIVGKLGQGAMGEVFRGHDPVLNRDVAIKRISSGLDADESLRKRFEREAQAVALLSHPNIITVFELGFEGDQMFMAMELLEGIDLKHAMGQRKLSYAEKLSTMEQICEGLAFAHARDLVHRDLKPANIHILPGGKVKIMDFGLARTAGSDMTSTGTVMGTPHYMSPEQVKGLKADARSDVFALGCVFYELLSGRKPFDAESMHGVLFKVMQDEPAPLGELAPDLPHALVQVVERALVKDPTERFQSAGELLAGLRLARAAGAARPGERAEPARAPTAAAQGAQREAGRSGTRPATRPPEKSSLPHPAAPRGRSYLAVGVVVGLVVVAAAAWAVRSLVTGPPAASPQPQVARLLADAIATRVQLAQRRLDASDFAAAVRDAESALKLDPANADAQAVLEEASDRLKRAEGAASALREAQARGGDVAAAAFELMKVDPASADAEKAAQASGPAFRRQAEEARSTAAQARESADNTGAKALPPFSDATTLEGQGQQALQSGQFVAAARRFLEARIRFERAERVARRPQKPLS
jgi:tetratricopeptide (TPR) repeat protein